MDNLKRQEKYLKFLSPGGTTLELGSGSGDFLKLCSKSEIRAEGVDNKRRPGPDSGCKVHHCDIIKFLKKTRKGAFSNIYARHIIEHFAPAEMNILILSAYKALNRGGRFVIITPNTNNAYVMAHEFWKDETHVRPYPRETAAKMLSEAGFKIIETAADPESWDSFFLKGIARKIREAVTGLKWEAPDCYIVAEK